MFYKSGGSKLEINLFQNSKLNKDFARSDNYINKRNFTLDTSIEDLKQHLSVDCDTPEFNAFVNEVVTALKSERECVEYVGGLSDNHFSLELLGVEKNSKDYMVLVDFSNSIDYALHLLSHCKMENVRTIPNYASISSAILNGKTRKIEDFTYSVFMRCDPALTRYMCELYWDVNRNSTESERNSENLLKKFIIIFYTKILEQIRVVKAYIMSYLHDLDDNFKYKSKTYAASLGTTEHPMENTEITLKMEGFDDYKIPLQVFKRYEYIDKLTKVKEEG